MFNVCGPFSYLSSMPYATIPGIITTSKQNKKFYKPFLSAVNC